jgi:DNA-binding transcriptional ArsR family regulator
MRDFEKLAFIFKTLSVETRVRIVQLLRQRSLCVNALANRLGISAAAVSQHLRVLRTAGIVKAEKLGYYVHYRLNESTLAKWKDRADGLLAPGKCEREIKSKGATPCATKKRSAKNRKT